jgi:hypothetical protein
VNSPERSITPHPLTITPRDIADRIELAGFVGFMCQFVESGVARDELTLATAGVVRMARELNADAVTVVAAVELIGCPPLLKPGEGARARGDRYAEAMAWLVRSLCGGD